VPSHESSRREFLRTAAQHSLILLSLPAVLSAREQASAVQAGKAAFTTLGADEAAELAAIAARIIPTDEMPGATEAGVIYFIDQVLGTSRPEALAPIRDGLTALQASARSTYQASTFRGLEPAKQDALLQAIETTPFFETMRYLTIAGMFSKPEYGGNRDGVGWRLIGFEDRHMWQPPFGFYDATQISGGR
jgi:gluconate 2-dehydrogenase gamma chain